MNLTRKQAVVFPSPVEKCQNTSYGLFKGNAHLRDGEKVLSCTRKIWKCTHSWYGMMTISKPGISSTTQLIRNSAACLTHFHWGNAPKLPRLCVQRMWSAAVRPGPPGMAFFFSVSTRHIAERKNGWGVHHLQFAVNSWNLKVFLMVISQYQGYTAIPFESVWPDEVIVDCPQWEKQGHASAAENVLGVMTNHCLFLRRYMKT